MGLEELGMDRPQTAGIRHAMETPQMTKEAKANAEGAERLRLFVEQAKYDDISPVTVTLGTLRHLYAALGAATERADTLELQLASARATHAMIRRDVLAAFGEKGSQ